MAPRAKITDEQRAEILARKQDDPTLTGAQLAREYGVDKATISRILTPKKSGAEPTSDTRMVAWSALRPNPRNYRKTFDPDSLVLLAQSIKQHGVLQNLLAHIADDGQLTITAGERRWRAVGLLVEAGEWDAAAENLPVRVIDGDDADQLALALLENLQRDDVNAMEEAEGFAGLQELDPDRWTARAIAEQIGVTDRHIQKRLRLVRDLTPQVRAALRNGEINAEQANILAAYARQSRQNQTLDLIKQGHYARATDLKRELQRELTPTKLALFDAADYQGRIVTDDETGDSYYADASQFESLQNTAIAKMQADLKKTYAWVEVVRGYFHWSQRTIPGHEKSGAVIQITYEGAVITHKDLVRDRDYRADTKTDTSSDDAPATPWTNSHLIAAKLAKTQVLQRAMADSPRAAIRIAVLALLGDHDACRIRHGYPDADDRLPDLDIHRKNRLAEALAPLRPAMDRGEDFDIDQHGVSTMYRLNGAGAWLILNDMADDQVADLFAQLVALQVGSFNGQWNATLGDNALVVAMAQTMGLMQREQDWGLALDQQPAAMEGLRRDAIERVARDVCPDDHLSDLKLADLKAHVAGQSDHNYVLPSYRFGHGPWLRVLFHFHDRPQDDAGKAENSPEQTDERPAPTRSRIADTSGYQRDENGLWNWDPEEMLGLIADDWFDEEADPTEPMIRQYITAGINAMARRDLDRPIPQDHRFGEPEEISTSANFILEEIFGLALNIKEYARIRTLADAIAHVCNNFGVTTEECK